MSRSVDPRSRLQELLDKQDITEVLYRYSRGMDRQDRALVRSCYHDDAIDLHGGFAGSVEKFLDWAVAYHAEQKLHQHLITNITIELDGDTAHVESYYVFYGSYPEPDDTLAVAGGRYVDRFEHRDGRWAIADRVCTAEWRADATQTHRWPVVDSSRLVEDVTASRDRDDVSYVRPLDLHHAPRNMRG
jgi:hypothetical protein